MELCIVQAFFWGILFSAAYFLGLWLTIRKVLRGSRPHVLLAGSFFIRCFLLLAAFFFVSNNRVENLLACFLGFMVFRVFSGKIIPPLMRSLGK